MKLLLFLSLVVCNQAFTQIAAGTFFGAKEYNKDQALYNAKTFLITNVLSASNDDVSFYVDPLVAANSGELTTLTYKCESQNKEGFIVGFFGTRWSDAGTTYLSYSYLNLPFKEANELLDKIAEVADKNKVFLDENMDYNNVFFKLGDLTCLVYKAPIGFLRIRIYWNGYDSEWEWSAFSKTRKRLARILK